MINPFRVCRRWLGKTAAEHVFFSCIIWIFTPVYSRCSFCTPTNKCVLPPLLFVSLSSGVFFLPHLPALPLPPAENCPCETAVAALLENVRTQRCKQMGRQLSVFLCEVIMCSPHCFCSHANEVDRIGNHFQTLSQGKSRNGKTKAQTKGCCAVVSVYMLQMRAEVEVKRGMAMCLCTRVFLSWCIFSIFANPLVHCQATMDMIVLVGEVQMDWNRITCSFDWQWWCPLQSFGASLVLVHVSSCCISHFFSALNLYLAVSSRGTGELQMRSHFVYGEEI